jgi:hypothetical protein
MMRSFILITCLAFMGCKPAPKFLTPPTVMSIDKPGRIVTEVEEKGPLPIISYHVDALTEVQDAVVIKSGATYKYAGITAMFETTPSQVRLDCSNGGTGIFICNADGAYLLIACEKMVFKISCEMF